MTSWRIISLGIEGIMSNLSRDGVDNVYYNAIIRNPVTSGGYVPMVYKQENSQPILMNPSEYKMAIVRLNIPADSLPLFFFKSNFWSITLTYGGSDYMEFLQYVPCVDALYDPDSIDQPVYYYSQMIESFNNAFLAAHARIIVDFPSAPAYPPILIFSQSTQLFSFIIPRDYLVDPIVVYMNADTALFFQTIAFYSLGRGLPFGKDTYLVVQNQYNNYYPVASDPSVDFNNGTATYPAFQFTSAFPYFRQWNQLDSIIITSNSLPTRREVVGVVTPSGINVQSFSSIMTDFVPQVNTNSDVLSSFYFYPQGPYRLIDMTDVNPLYNIDFTIYWVSTDGTTRLLQLTPGNVASVKFLFMKKTALNFINAGGV